MGKKYKLVLRYYDDAGFFDGIEVENPELVRIVPFPAPEEGARDYVAVYEFVPVEEGEESE